MQRFTISRNGQTYGPYSMDELQRYLASGHVLLTDLARADDASEWIPVSQILASTGGAPASAAPVFGTVPAVGYNPPYAAGGFPDPPNLHWGLVLLLDVVTCSFFQMVWNIVLASWFRRINPQSKALPLYIASAVLIVAQAIGGQFAGISRHGLSTTGGYDVRAFMLHGSGLAVYGLISIACWVVRLIARFSFRTELERHYNTVEPLALEINPVLTFFFGGIYLQSVMNEINRRKQYARIGNYGPR